MLGSSLREQKQNLEQALTYPKHCGSNLRCENKYWTYISSYTIAKTNSSVAGFLCGAAGMQ